MNQWSEEYKKVIYEMFNGIDNYLVLKLKLRRPMIKQIIKYASYDKPIIECGTGTGKLSALFAKLGFDAYGIDVDDDMLRIAKKISEKISPK
ncbi:MAG: class I SAM-dependent methyltransferase [Oscillospiraceae bacterium]|jgi:2-polyprenyl-3-methyl-5-hydroxy-6-metoxy-1,4-benzoquinol methylase|nr:class I SAM-dependent methyltransferase [Oscillospiraceae bacterium]